MTIEELKQEMLELRRELADAEKRYHAALIEAHPLKPGDIIRSNKGTMARVLHVRVLYDKIRITAVLKNRDGNFGKKPAPMWRDEWDNPELVERS